MTFAYSDPPYLGQGKRLYGAHPEAAIYDDPETHRRMIAEMTKVYPDGWAMSLSTPSMQTILPMCPPDVRIGSWVKTFCAFKKGVRPCYSWEPVVFWRGRNPPIERHPPPVKGGKQTTPKDFLRTDYDEGLLTPVIAESITLKKGLTGAKPEKFCHWVLDLLNFQPGDVMVDLFPGTGIMGRVVADRSEVA
jgi:hypothetical protein